MSLAPSTGFGLPRPSVPSPPLPYSILLRLKAKNIGRVKTPRAGCCDGPTPASYNAESGARINRRAGFDNLVASCTARAVVRFRTE